MSDWETKNLADLLDRPLAYGVLKPGPYEEGGIPLVRIQDHKDGEIKSNSLHKIPIALHHEFKRTELRDGDIIISVVGTIGRTAIIPKHLTGANVSRAFAVIGCSDEIDKHFLDQYLKSDISQSWFKEQCQGNAQQVLNLGTLRGYPVPIPPLPEQKKIAEILSGIDFLENALNSLIVKQISLRKAITLDLMSHGAGNKVLKDSERGKIPFDWEVLPLGSIFTLTSGKSKPKSLLSSMATDCEKIPVYGGNGITGYTADHLLDLPTIAIGRVGEYCGAVHLTPTKSWVTDNALYIKDRILDFDLPFMYYFLAYCEISKMRKQGGQPLVSQKPILDLVVAIPTTEEQRRIALILDSISNNIFLLEGRRQRVRDLKDSISQDLLSGRKRVSI